MAYLTNTVKNVSGKEISISDSYKLKDYVLEGDTYQEQTTQNENWCPPFTDSRWVFTGGASVTSDGYLSIPASASATATIRIPWNKSRILAFKNIIVSGGNAYYNVGYYGSDGTKLSGNGKAFANKEDNYNDSTSFGGNNQYGDALAQSTEISLTFGYNSAYGMTNPYVVKDLIVNSTFVDYVPFVPDSPSPDYPQEIQVVSGNNTIEVVGKNLFNKDTTNVLNAYISASNTISASGTDRLVWLPIEKNTDYAISITQIALSTSTAVDDFQVGLFTSQPALSSVGNRIFNQQRTSATSDYTFNTTFNSGNYGYLAMKVCNTQRSNYTETLKTLQVEKGNQATTYEEYKGTSYEIKLRSKNLFDISRINSSNSLINNGDGTLSVKGYGVGGLAPSYLKSYCPELKVGDEITFTFDTTSTNKFIYLYGTGANFTWANNTTKTITQAMLNSSVLWYGASGGDTTFYTISNVMMRKSTETSDYEPYFTPIWLGGINDYKDRIYRTSGNNLFNDSVERKNAYVGTTVGSAVVYYNSTASYSYVNCAYVEAGKTYTFSWNKNTPASTNTRNGVIVNSNNIVLEVIVSWLDAQTHITFTPTHSGFLIPTIDKNSTNVILNEGNTALDYEPYGSNNEYYLKKEMGKVVLNGSESWNRYTDTSKPVFYLTFYSYKKENGLKCYSNYFSGKGQVTTFDNVYDLGNNVIALRNPLDRLAIRDDSITSIEDFKTWLSNNNVTLYYVLATPTYEKITNSTLIEQLEAVRLLYGYNDITVDNVDLPATLSLEYYSTDNPYQDAVYSQDDKNDLKIYFNDVELEDASRYCEKITRTARILPNDGNKRFSLDNFISTSVDVILHDVDLEDIVDQVRIEIGTDVGNNTYQYIPLGIFNIQDTPVKDKNKITLKLRDNRVKFDFNYNASPLMESLGGTATKRQILEDICEQAGVENIIDHFDNEEDELGIYDNSITATTYVSYLMEQAGLIPIINREGKLATVNLGELDKWRIPLSIVESYEKGEPYKIDRVVYESGVIKYETDEDETLDTLYINSANPYISRNEQVENILTKLNDFEIDSITTKRVLGNPAIDPYDIIEIYDDLNGTNDVVFRTLANTTYTFNGVHRDKFDTQIGKEERTENVTKNSEASYRKLAKTEIDNINANILLVSSTTESYHEDSLEQINDLITRTNTVEQRITSTEANIEVIEQQIVDGQQTLKNNLVTIDINGINVSTNTSAIATLMTNEKFVIRSGNTILAFFGYDAEINSTKAEMDNLTVTNYFISGYHRTEKMNVNGEKRTGQFFIGGRL